MRFRAQNNVIINRISTLLFIYCRCYITTQNHGYAVDAKSIPKNSGWSELFINANDGSNEGLIHDTKPIFTVQFHPEHNAGPEDLEVLFDAFFDMIKTPNVAPKQLIAKRLHVDLDEKRTTDVFRPKKVLILGSGVYYKMDIVGIIGIISPTF